MTVSATFPYVPRERRKCACGRFFSSDDPSVVLCSRCRPKRKEPLKNCRQCGKEFKPRTSLGVFCSEECYKKSQCKYPDGKTIHCECCGKEIRYAGPSQIVCKEKCRPKDGFVRFCAYCGEPGGYDDFYDYRGSASGDGKFLTTCKKCLRERTLKRYHERRTK